MKILNKRGRMPTGCDLELDVTGQCCPIPLMHLAKAVRSLRPGQTIRITGNDPIFSPSVKDFCRANGHVIVESSSDGHHSFTYVIKTGGADE